MATELIRTKRSAIYRQLAELRRAYLHGEYKVGEQFARVDLETFCKRHHVGGCFRCGRVETNTATGRQTFCASCQATMSPIWF